MILQKRRIQTDTLWKGLTNSFGKVCLETASYCTVKSQSKKGSFIDFQRKVENLAVVGDLTCFFAWPCDSGNHPAKFN
jgi:hypothetical protein